MTIWPNFSHFNILAVLGFQTLGKEIIGEIRQHESVVSSNRNDKAINYRFAFPFFLWEGVVTEHDDSWRKWAKIEDKDQWQREITNKVKSLTLNCSFILHFPFCESLSTNWSFLFQFCVQIFGLLCCLLRQFPSLSHNWRGFWFCC